MRPRAPRLIGFGRRNWTHVPILGADDPWEPIHLIPFPARQRCGRRDVSGAGEIELLLEFIY